MHSLDVVTNRVEIQSESIWQRRRESHRHSTAAQLRQAESAAEATVVAIDERQMNMAMVVATMMKAIAEESRWWTRLSPWCWLWWWWLLLLLMMIM